MVVATERESETLGPRQIFRRRHGRHAISTLLEAFLGSCIDMAYFVAIRTC
jgi:hypothetical protein